MATNVTVRVVSQLNPDQVSQLADILIAVVEQGASVGFLPPLERAEAEEYWRAATGLEVVLLVAERDGRIVGTAQLLLAPRPNARHRAEVAKVLVRPECQRQGLGRALMERIEAIARERGRTLLILDTREGDPSNRLYRALGYVEAGRIPRFARSATGQLDATVIYFKELKE